MKRLLLVALLISGLSPLFSQSKMVSASSSHEVVKLPDQGSFIYPDTFAVYWRPYQRLPGDGFQSLSLQQQTIYGDLINETEFTADSIIWLPFHKDYVDERSLIIAWVSAVSDKVISDRNKVPKAVTIHRQDPEVEAIRSLTSASYSYSNLKLLADVYEKKRCFVNAYYVYSRLVIIDPVKGEKDFGGFFSRNSVTLDGNRADRSVLR